MAQVRPYVPVPVARALDIGCGAGLSTHALQTFANQCIGVEPAEAMLQWSSKVAPEADFVVGAAEAIPIGAGSVDLITAAGSLNYVDLNQFFGEAARILRPKGVLVVYDFSAGKSFREGAGLDHWFECFRNRYPPPPSEARVLDPIILSEFDSGFQVSRHEQVEVTIELSPDFYLEYMLTETNVAFAVRRGTPLKEIRSWCEDTLGPVWEGGAGKSCFEDILRVWSRFAGPDEFVVTRCRAGLETSATALWHNDCAVCR